MAEMSDDDTTLDRRRKPDDSVSMFAFDNFKAQMDSRFNKLVEDTTALKIHMEENTEITTQVRDLLGSFRIVAAIAKWVSVIGGAVAAGIAAVKGVKGG